MARTKCPTCDEALRRKRYHDMIVDACEACKGLWFDERELGDFLQRYVEEHADVPNASLRRVSSPRRDAHAPEMQCPECGGARRVRGARGRVLGGVGDCAAVQSGEEAATHRELNTPTRIPHEQMFGVRFDWCYSCQRRQS